MKTRKTIGILSGIILFLLVQFQAFAHCEIPCGIYGDSLRIQLLKEHITTIEKSMNEINNLSGNGEKNYNQLVRWVVNKEEHAIKIQEIVSQYFLHQRVKFAGDDDSEEHHRYVEQLISLHQILVYAMKAKQTTDLTLIKKLNDMVDAFAHLYFHKHEHSHS
jgi:nickel superoxide dismutase